MLDMTFRCQRHNVFRWGSSISARSHAYASVGLALGVAPYVIARSAATKQSRSPAWEIASLRSQ